MPAAPAVERPARRARELDGYVESALLGCDVAAGHDARDTPLGETQGLEAALSAFVRVPGRLVVAAKGGRPGDVLRGLCALLLELRLAEAALRVEREGFRVFDPIRHERGRPRRQHALGVLDDVGLDADIRLGDAGSGAAVLKRLADMAVVALAMGAFVLLRRGRRPASRSALLTGCYPQRVGMPGVLFPGCEKGLHPSEITLGRGAHLARQEAGEESD